MTIGNKITDIKRQFLKAMQQGETAKAQELKAAIVAAEKFGWMDGWEFPIFVGYETMPDGSILAKTECINGCNTSDAPGVVLTTNELEALSHLKQTIFWIETYEGEPGTGKYGIC